MTNGAIIFAQNNSSLNYVKMAEFAASKIQKHLDVPVSLITDTPDAVTTTTVFDQIIPTASTHDGTRKYRDGEEVHTKLEWKNSTRSNAYNLTPYDKTLVIDSDYIINSSVLKPAFDLDYDLQIYKNSFDLGQRNLPEFKEVTQYSIPFYWATTFMFKKSVAMEAFFKIVDYVKYNWIYFKELYGLPAPMFRNDYAFSIAVHLMHNKSDGIFAMELPGTMSFILDADILTEIKDDSMQFLLQKPKTADEYIAVKTQGLDVHVMNKFSLLRAIS